MKICPVGVELFHADGQTDGWADGDMTKLIVAYVYWTVHHCDS